MRQQEKRGVDSPFIEELWLGLVYQLADTQEWINRMARNLLLQLPISGLAGLQQPGYSLSITALAHILRQHAAPNKKIGFRLPVPAIVALLIETGKQEAVALPGGNQLKRVLRTNSIVGINSKGKAVKTITVICNPGGEIMDAFPGEVGSKE